MSWGKGSPPLQVTSEQEIESRVVSVCWLGQTFLGFNSKWSFLVIFLGKAKWEIGVGILSSDFYLNVQALGVSRIVIL